MYKVADIVFEAEGCGELFSERAVPYRIDSGEPEFTIGVTEGELASARNILPKVSDDGLRYLRSGSKFYRALISRGGLMLHSSAVVKDGRAYLFSGPSGMGKSTHTGYWLDLFPDAYVLNDDKPAIRLKDEGIFAYGTPWSGKHDISRNERVPIAGIAFLERADHNFIEPLPAAEAAGKLLPQTERYIPPRFMAMLLELLDRLLREIPVYRLGCIADRSAAALSHSVMSSGFNNRDISF